GQGFQHAAALNKMTLPIPIHPFSAEVSPVALNHLFQPFIEQKPVCVMARIALERLLYPKAIDALLGDTAHRQYTRDLLCSDLFELMAGVVLHRRPSARAAYKRLAHRLRVSDQAVYNNRHRVELRVSAALVHYSAQRVVPVLRALHALEPSWVPGYRV